MYIALYLTVILYASQSVYVWICMLLLNMTESGGIVNKEGAQTRRNVYWSAEQKYRARWSWLQSNSYCIL